MTDAHIGVIGTGSIGSMAMWQATRHETSVIGFEAKTPAHPRTAVGGDSRLFRMTYRGTDPYFPILKRSRELWLELEKDSGSSVFGQCGGLSIGHRDGSYIPALLESIDACGAEHRILDHAEMKERYPQHDLDSDEVGVWDAQAGYLRTDAAVLAALTCARERGATVLTDTNITSVTEHNDYVEVSDGDQSWTVDRLIVTGGAWAGGILPDALQRRVYPARILLTWFGTQRPDLFTPEVFPIFIRIARGTSMYGAPCLDGASVKASLDGRAERADDPSDLLREPTLGEMTEVRGTAASYFPDLVPYVVRADTYPDLYTDDGAPLLGFAPGSRRVVLATGFCGAGFKMATGYGQIAADLALDPNSARTPKFTDPARFMV
ncbi:FAD-dependent oxidoreductase [Rudaeicoccus suwonensis]|uniref:Sarcosine oxidase n=1 Tax=Rudaeicoccus suwonensis TaxID=657409 RepID=A0A561E3S2_9MICO|nr:FAD-dependent oxidoreductase [Rudaeicoccus suwonensis]TWE10264.1 sarcosine oxidase [Rudaeicoccus suwonensis]